MKETGVFTRTFSGLLRTVSPLDNGSGERGAGDSLRSIFPGPAPDLLILSLWPWNVTTRTISLGDSEAHRVQNHRLMGCKLAQETKIFSFHKTCTECSRWAFTESSLSPSAVRE